MKFTVIVPVYNVKEYLIDCLKSIKSQSFEDFECLVINDGSTDDSGGLAERFCQQYDNFHYYKKENGGLSDARNYGVVRAKGEYLVFIDSDDLVSHALLYQIEKAIQTSHADLVYFAYTRFTDDSAVDLQSYSPLDAQPIDQAQLSRYPNFAWARVGKRSLYQDNLFPKGYIYEDAVTTPILSYRAKNIVELKNKLYFYRRRDGSITTGSAIKQFKLFDTLAVLLERCQRLSVPSVYYHTAFVNLSKSIIVSLARIQNQKSFYHYLFHVWREMDKLSFRDGIKSHSFLISKILFIILKIKWLALPFYYLIKLIMKIFNK